MDKETDELVENIRHTNSQKSIATSLMYSLDFTDSSSESHNSTSMDTYVLDCDSETSESPRSKNNTHVTDKTKTLCTSKDIQSYECTTLHEYSVFAQESFTQTSKTIIELARNDGALLKSMDCKTLETQTSMISIIENKTVTYKIEMASINKAPSSIDVSKENVTCDQILNKSLEDYSSKSQSMQNEAKSMSEKITECDNEVISVDVKVETENTLKSDFDSSSDSSDVDQDSLMEPIRLKSNCRNNSEEEIKTPKSVDMDVAELYSKLYDSIEIQRHKPFEQNSPGFGHLTPLSEESATCKNSTVDFKPNNNVDSIEEDKDVLFTNTAGMRVKFFPEERTAEVLKLPPIQTAHSSSRNANLNFLFSGNNLETRSKALSSLYEERDEKSDRWELGAREMASGEGSFVNVRNDEIKVSQFLPPIHFVSANAQYDIKIKSPVASKERAVASELQSPITIKDKIKELKMSHKGRNWCHTKFSILKSDSRSLSPSAESDVSRGSSPAERGCELMCAELLRKLHSGSWSDVVDTLEDIPRQLDRFWNVITEYRIADLLRQVSAHIESPRTQVARTACNILAIILKNTNYTKKPEFYEAMTILLTKTGSFSRPVRRAANVALDDIVCGVELSHTVTAICVHGVTHKSPLVRCAAARLLVVCCALGGGGRELLRSRPVTAACARRHVLRALATLLEDKSSETRKYAERLYSMLRPLSAFEAYYISDLDTELASRQIKKFDKLLLCGLPETR